MGALGPQLNRFAPWVSTLLLAVLLFACDSRPKETPIPRGAVVVVLGDSITAGYGLNADSAWVMHLSQATGWQVVNAGVSGDTSAQGLARLPGLLQEHRPAAVIVELGGNDMLRRTGEAEVAANLEAIVNAVRAEGARPVLLAIPKPTVAGAAFGTLSDAPLYGELAARAKLPLVGDAVAEVLSRSEWRLDALHPNAQGHRELAARVIAKMRRLGLIG
jgi:acyl-CoA thioesterase I